MAESHSATVVNIELHLYAFCWMIYAVGTTPSLGAAGQPMLLVRPCGAYWVFAAVAYAAVLPGRAAGLSLPRYQPAPRSTDRAGRCGAAEACSAMPIFQRRPVSVAGCGIW